jgi:hypothetical protein
MNYRITWPALCLISAFLAIWFIDSDHRASIRDVRQNANAVAGNVRVMEADVARLKDSASDQAHAMVSVAYHFNNMWFAAQAENWPLAEFYWGETRSHLRWAVRIIPVRKDNAGNEVKLKDILEALENNPLKQLHQAIAAQDNEKFAAAYQFTVEACYACHKAADKPYLRPKMPDRPAEASMNFDPHAAWPL